MSRDIHYFLSEHNTGELLSAVLSANKKYGAKLPDGSERQRIIANHYEEFLNDKNQWSDFTVRAQELARAIPDLKEFLYHHAETVVGRGEVTQQHQYATRELREKALDRAAEGLFFHPVKMLSLINSDMKKSRDRSGFSKSDHGSSRPRSERRVSVDGGKFYQGDDGYIGRK